MRKSLSEIRQSVNISHCDFSCMENYVQVTCRLITFIIMSKDSNEMIIQTTNSRN